MITKLRFVFLLLSMFGVNCIFAQTRPAPTIHYPTPPAYYLNTAIKPLTPVSANVDTQGYSGYSRTISTDHILYASGVASDAAGNIFISTTDGHILEVPVNSSDTVSIAGGAFKQAGIAVDAAGNIFIADIGHNTIDKMTLSGSTYSKRVAVASGFNSPYGVAVDAAGNLYVGDSGNNLVKKIAYNGSTYSAPVAIGNGFSNPCQVAVDAAGNVFVADKGNNAIKKIPVSGGAPVSVGLGISAPTGVAVDLAGNVFVLEYTNNDTKEIPAGGGPTVKIGGFIYMGAYLNLNPFGYLYAATVNDEFVYRIGPTGGYYLNKALPAGMSFNSETGVINGSPTVTSPATTYIVSAYQSVNTIYQDNVGVKTSFSFSVGAGLNIATLSNLAVSAGTLSPAFATGTTTYTAVVGSGVSSVTLTPTATASAAAITVNGTAVATGTASAAIPLAVGANIINTVVTSNDGTTTTAYKLTVTRQATNNTNLAHLAISAGTLSPAFAAGTTAYTATVGNSTASMTATPTLADPSATVTVNGTVVSSGSPSGAIDLRVGANKINIMVTAHDGVTTKTYTVTVTRLAYYNPDLSALTVSNGTLTQPFTPETTLDSTFVGNGLKTFTVTPTAADPAATITVNGTAVASGTPSQYLPLTVGFTTITIVVTASDGITQKTYKLLVNEARSSVNTLSALVLSTGTLTPVFTPNTVTYTQTTSYNTTSVTVTATLKDTTATLYVYGQTLASGETSAPITLSVGDNTIDVVVTAQNQTKKTYTITITVPKSTNSGLANIVVSKGTLTPVFATATTSYTDMVTNSTTSVTVKPTLSDATATMTYNGTAFASGGTTPAIPLNVGSNPVTFIVTAQDGTTQTTYTINVIRPSTNAKLAGLTISRGTLTPAFNTNTTSYTASVTNATASITLTPTVAVTGATVKVNGTTVTSGAASGAIALTVGSNTITTVVTAQDGTTTDTYTLTVTRATAGENIPDAAVSVGVQNFEPLIADDGINVHQSVSPNGDGINDFLQIDNISQFPDNKLSIMNRNGQLIFEAKAYDNATKVFDGHSNKTGQMQLPGTYFYELDYAVNGIIKHKTGFLVLKY